MIFIHIKHLYFLLFSCCRSQHDLLNPGSLVGPGAIQPYLGPQERRTYGVVREWPAGFFVGGSSLRALNGLYSKVQKDHGSPHLIEHTYESEDSHWVLGFVPDGEGHHYTRAGGTPNEWVFIDSEGHDRFAHAGETLIPGAGRSWQSVHRQEYAGRFQIGDLVKTRTSIEGVWEAETHAEVIDVRYRNHDDNPVTIKLNNGNNINTQAWRLRRIVEEESALVADGASSLGKEDELPWQIVAIMDEGKLSDLLRQKREFDEQARQAQTHLERSLPYLPPGEIGVHEPSSETVPEPQAEKLCKEGKTADGLELLDRSLASSSDKTTRAALYTQQAFCHRLASRPALAIEASKQALALFPRNRVALFQQGLAFLDAVQPADAVRTFESILRIEPDFPDLARWLLHSHSRARRQGRGPVVDGFYIGDLLEARATYEGLWIAGERAQVVGLGNCHAPLLVKLESSGRSINTQTEHFYAVSPADAVSNAATSKDHYSILNLRADFSDEDLRKAYRDASRKSHPDLGGSNDFFQDVAEAHRVLGDPQQREAYDRGDDLPRFEVPLQAEVERRYFPEALEFQPFGDPVKERRKQEESDRREAEHIRRLRGEEL